MNQCVLISTTVGVRGQFCMCVSQLLVVLSLLPTLIPTHPLLLLPRPFYFFSFRFPIWEGKHGRHYRQHSLCLPTLAPYSITHLQNCLCISPFSLVQPTSSYILLLLEMSMGTPWRTCACLCVSTGLTFPQRGSSFYWYSIREPSIQNSNSCCFALWFPNWPIGDNLYFPQKFFHSWLRSYWGPRGRCHAGMHFYQEVYSHPRLANYVSF